MCQQTNCACATALEQSRASKQSNHSPVILAILPSGNNSIDSSTDNDDNELKRWPSGPEVVEELKRIGCIAGPMMLLGSLLYLRAMFSMVFLGRLGELELAGGSLAIGVANITGYSVLSGLAMGMEPICGQAFGAKKWNLMGLALQRTILVLICACFPIGFLWINMNRILLFVGQDESITAMASTYLLFSLPDLAAQALLNPLRIYLRSQSITVPLMWGAGCSLAMHLLINQILVTWLKMGIRGVALAAALTDFQLVIFLLGYLYVSGTHKKSWEGWSVKCLKELKPFMKLALPSCASVCLEWWWYEFMIITSAFLDDSEATVAAMGILIQTTSLVYIFPSSLSLAVSTRVGNELGANRPSKARFAMLVALGCAAVIAVLALTFTFTMRHVWGTMFTTDERILSLTALAMPIIGLCELGNCPQTTGCGGLRGSARPSTGANINLGSFYIMGMPVAILLGFRFKVGFVGLWFGLLAAQGTCVILMLFVLLRTDWKLQAARAKQLTGSVEEVISSVSQTEFRDVTEMNHMYRDEEEELEALISIRLMQPHINHECLINI